MSLMQESPSTVPKLLLRSADQYSLWKARASAACWSITQRDVFAVTDEQCGFGALEEGQERKIPEWVGKAWMALIGSLHDKLFIRLVRRARTYRHATSRNTSGIISECRYAWIYIRSPWLGTAHPTYNRISLTFLNEKINSPS